MGGETALVDSVMLWPFPREHGRRAHAPWPNQDGTRLYCVFECIVTVKTLGNRGTVCPEPLRSAAGTPPLH